MTKETIKEEFKKKELEILQEYMFERASNIKGAHTFEDILIAWDVVTDNEKLNNLSEERKRFGADLIIVLEYNKDGSVTNDYGETYRKWEVLTEEYIKDREYYLKYMIVSRKAENAETRREKAQYMQLRFNYLKLSQEYNKATHKL